MEVHIIELGKELRGDRLDSWIQLFNAENEEELDMLAAKYKGLAEAAEIMKRLSLGKMLRYQYQEHLKAVRDRYGEDEYVRDQGRTEGITIGRTEGISVGRAEGIAEGINVGKAEGITIGRAEGITIGRTEGISVGRTEGKADSILQLLSDLGEIPDGLRERIRKETDPQVLAGWLKAAARAESISDFENKTASGQPTE